MKASPLKRLIVNPSRDQTVIVVDQLVATIAVARLAWTIDGHRAHGAPLWRVMKLAWTG